MDNRNLLIATLALLVPYGLAAQETRGMIFGRILDPQQAPVASANVTVTNTSTNTSLQLKSNETGYYEANLLLPGSYQVTAEAAGFKKIVRHGITVSLGARVLVDLVLELGSISEAISVTAEAPLLETNAVSSGVVLDSRSLRDLPVARGNAVMLAEFTPGVQTRAWRGQANHAANIITNEMYNPGRVGGNEFLIDGVTNTGGSRRIAYMPHTDTLQEFKIESSNFDASVGHSTGLTMNFMSRSGTNDFHGVLSNQHWQKRWGAAPFFAAQAYYRSIAQAEAQGNTTLANQIRSQPKQASARLNSYSAVIGGPVILPKIVNGRNKLFFVFSFNGANDRSVETGSINNTLPTLAQRQGDFSDLLPVNPVRYQIYDPLSVRADPARPGHFIRDAFAGNIIPASRRVNPAYESYVKFLPQPNNNPTRATDEPLNNYLAVAIPWISDYYAITNRIDYQHSNAHRFFCRWNWSRFYEDRSNWAYEVAPGLQSNDLLRRNVGGTADWVYMINPSTLLDVAAAVNQYQDGRFFTVAKSYRPSDVGLPTYLDARAADQHILPRMQFAGYQALGNSFPTLAQYRTDTIKIDMSHIRSSHTVRAGFDTRLQFRTGGGGGYTSGQFAFANDFTRRNDDTLTPAGDLGHSWAAFLMGLPSQAIVDTNASFATYNPTFGWYLQDNWRVNPRLTLNLGMRLEYEVGATERYNRLIGAFDPAASLMISDAARAAYARNPVPERPASDFQVRGGSNYPGSGGVGRKVWPNELLWMPRLGASYQLNSKTVLRAGYGIFHDTLNVLYQAPNQLGFSRTTSTILTTDFGMSWGAGDPGHGISPLRDPFPVRGDGTRFDEPVRDGLGRMAVAGRSFSFLDDTARRARQQRWRLGVQRQLGPSMVLEVAYAGAYSDRVNMSKPLNPLSEQFWADGLVRNDAMASNMNSNVTNPFLVSNFSGLQANAPLVYQDVNANSFFRSSTIRKNQLLRPFPHMTGLTNSFAPVGEAKSHELDVNFVRRFSKGFNLSLGYTRLSAHEADFFYNEFDLAPSWEPTTEGRPHRFFATSVWELPFGKGRAFLNKGLGNYVVGGWQLGLTYQYQPGQILDFPNLFYYGDLKDIEKDHPTLEGRFNTANFERNASKAPAAYHRRVFPTRVDGVRDWSLNEWSGNLQRDFNLTEKVRLQFRVDALNLFNRTQFWMIFDSAPKDPLSTNFGRTLSEQEGSKRYLQFQARIQF